MDKEQSVNKKTGIKGIKDVKDIKDIKCIKCSKVPYCSGLCKEHFMNYFEKKVWRTIHKFQLFNKQEKLAVAVSGGKDSTVCLYVLKKLGYKAEGITVDAVIGSYTRKNLENLRKVCKDYEIKLNEISFREEFGLSLCYIKNRAAAKGLGYSSCLICGVLRRYLLNKFAREHKFEAIATGHNLDDEAQAFIMNVFRNDLTLAFRQGPITGSGGSKGFVKRVKPLYMCTEKETTAYSKLMKFPVNYERCPCSSNAYRREYRAMLDDFEKRHPPIKYNIVNFFLRTLYSGRKNSGKSSDYGSSGLDSDGRGRSEANACIYCKEPCANDVCKRCQILIALKDGIHKS